MDGAQASAGALAAPEILGGPSSLWFTQIIYRWFNTGGNWPQGAAYAIVLLLACLLLAACAYPPPQPPPPGVASVPAPVLKEGDFWEYAVRDAYTGVSRGLYRYTVAREDAQSITVEVTRDGERIDTHFYAAGWRGLEHPLRNLQRLRYQPPYPAYLFPLYPGQHWRVVVESTDPATGSTYNTHVHATVGGWRRIKVPAGEFVAVPGGDPLPRKQLVRLDPGAGASA